MPIPKHLTGALIAYLKGTTWGSAMRGGIRSDEAPRDNPVPYCVVQKADSSSLAIFGGRWIDTRTMVLNVYDTDRVRAEDLGNQLRDLLLPTEGYAPPPLLFQEGIDSNRMPAGGDAIEIDPERGPLGADFWAYRLPIHWTVARG